MRIPTNRIVAFIGPAIAFASSTVAAWLIAKVNVLGLPGLDQANVATWIAAGLTAALVAGLHALGGWKWLKGHHIELAAADVLDQVPDEAPPVNQPVTSPDAILPDVGTATP